jgi:prevent-host-death family protein
VVAPVKGSTARSVNVAEAKRSLSDLLGRVAYGGETVLITRRGRPMARLVPAVPGDAAGLAGVRGWLDAGDPFFATIDDIVTTRVAHRPRVLRRRGRPARSS